MSGRVIGLAAVVYGVCGVVLAPYAVAGEPSIGPNGLMGGGGGGGRNRMILRAGNGKYNQTITVLSPSINRGLQQIANTNTAAMGNTQAVVCLRRWRSCNIRQSMSVGGIRTVTGW